MNIKIIFILTLLTFALLLTGCMNVPLPSEPTITLNPSKPVAGQNVKIVAKSSDDYSNVRFSLELDGNALDGTQSRNSFVANWMAVKGDHVVRVTVTDDYDHSVSATKIIEVGLPSSPVIKKILWSPLYPRGGDQLNIVIQATSVIGFSDASLNIDSMPLHLTSNGAGNYSATCEAIPGTHQLIASVVDKLETVSSTSVTLKVSNYPYPQIERFTWTPQNPLPNDTVVFKMITISNNADNSYANISVDGKDLETVADSKASGTTFIATWTKVPAGYHMVKAKVVDSTNGWYNEQTQYVPIAPQNSDLNVVIGVNPLNPQHGDNVVISAVAFDSYAPIEKITLFVDNVKVHEVSSTNTICYTFKPSDGTHNITINAKDKLGNSATKIKLLYVTFNPSLYPPKLLAKFTLTATVDDAKILSAYATATAPEATMKKLVFINMLLSKEIGESTFGSNGMFSISWIPKESGNIPILIEAIDSNNVTAATTVMVKVSPKLSNNGAPLIYPDLPSTVIKEFSRMTLSATVVSSTRMKNVDMWVDGTPMTPFKSSNDFYSINWIADSTGTHLFRVYAEDVYGREATSDFYFYVYPSNLPELSLIIAPKSVYLGGKIVATATILKSSAPISVVNFYVDRSLASSAYSPPYKLEWTTKTLGSHVLTVEAVDAYGNKGYSTVVFNVYEDKTPPFLTISMPSTALTNENIKLCITSSDNESGMKNVKVNVYSSKAPQPYPDILPIFTRVYTNPATHIIFDFKPKESATYTVYVTAEDQKGNLSEKQGKVSVF